MIEIRYDEVKLTKKIVVIGRGENDGKFKLDGKGQIKKQKEWWVGWKCQIGFSGGDREEKKWSHWSECSSYLAGTAHNESN